MLTYDTGTSPKTYNNLTPGTHTVNIQALAIKLDRLLQPVIATRTFTIQEAGKMYSGSAQSTIVLTIQ